MIVDDTMNPEMETEDEGLEKLESLVRHFDDSEIPF